jgi:hypothetical protein
MPLNGNNDNYLAASLLRRLVWLQAAFGALGALAQGTPEYELPPIEYSLRTPTNAVSRLEAGMSAARPGTTEVPFVRWFLGQAGVPVESQSCRFRTSLQRDLISPVTRVPCFSPTISTSGGFQAG